MRRGNVPHSVVMLVPAATASLPTAAAGASLPAVTTAPPLEVARSTAAATVRDPEARSTAAATVRDPEVVPAAAVFTIMRLFQVGHPDYFRFRRHEYIFFCF